jgi:hypothetical protein
MKGLCAMKKRTLYLIIIAAFLVAGGILLGLALGTSPSGKNNNPENATSHANTGASVPVKSLVSYTLPDGWTDTTCPASADVTYIVPAGITLNCTAPSPAPVKAYVDPQNTTDCKQLQPRSEQNQIIRKHVCSSLYIDNHKTLKALTEYGATSPDKADTGFADYYFDTSKGVVKFEYAYTASNLYQTDFNRLALSLKSR